MNYYSHHIGDFNAATRHLDFMERAIYKELIELQYDLETPIPDDISWIMKRACIPNERSTDVERMLNEFFDLVEQGWSNARCEHEIEAFQAKREAAIKAGKASGKARRRNKKPNKINKNEQKGTTVERTLNERCDFVEPTNNQEPITNNQDKHICAFSDFWNLYPVKKQKKTAQGIWQRKKLNNKAEEIITALQNQIANDSQWSAGYVPNPTTYLNQERWTDEISRGSHSSQQTKSEQSKQALRDWVNQD